LARGAHYRVAFRRRREGATDYAARRKMVASNLPRFVVRDSLKNTCIQLIKATAKGDQTLVSANSKELRDEYGWKAPRGNLPAAYLTGLLAGHRALAKGYKQAILDIGLQDTTVGAKVFAALKGATDAGLEIPNTGDILPSEARIRGEHVATYAEEAGKTNPEAYKRVFSGYLAAGLRPEELPKHFDQTKKTIEDAFKGGQ